jgi:succinate-semialdehyde dehydrogenase/glutarate-semialdehyde dehydrogenase
VTIQQPVGVVAAITSWNFPNAMITRKVGPALAVGCTMVLKLASATPLSAYALEYLAADAGVPPGVFRVMFSRSAEAVGAELATNPKMAKLTFTGSTEVGKTLLAQSASTVKKVSMELGGNAPFIVFDDADLDAAVRGALVSKFRNTGQTCVCANRLLAQANAYDVFAEMLATAVRALRVGNALDGDFDQGPLINNDAVEKIQQHINDATDKGARIVAGGTLHELGGSFFQPTVLTGVTGKMLVADEETFGSVAPLFRFETEDEAIELANATEFGLAAYFYSRYIGRVWRVAEAIEAGMVGVNDGFISTEVAPFGGVKQSGLGREGSKYGTEDYLETKYLCFGGI